MGSARWRGAFFVRALLRSRASLLKVAVARAQARSGLAFRGPKNAVDDLERRPSARIEPSA
jgi:hypothetical protein